MWSKPTALQAGQIEASTSPERLRRYRAVTGGRRDQALELYLADAELASHFHAHLRMVEVIMREHIHRALSTAYDPRWYISQASALGGNCPSMLDTARSSLGPAKWKNPGYVVAELMLGFWAGLLQGPTGGDHQRLWDDALESVFNARGDVAPWGRHDAMLVCKRLNWARNRVNHCESVIYGFPQKGMVQRKQLRLPPSMILDDCRRLVGRFGPELQDWLSSSKQTDALLSRTDVQQAWAHVESDSRIVTPADVATKFWQVP